MKKTLFAAIGCLVLLTLTQAHAQLKVTEAMSSEGGTSNYGQDWFELTNFGTSALNISGYKMDDNSGGFAAAVTLNGVTSIAAGESVIFVESQSSTPSTIASIVNNFETSWFGSTGNTPAGLQIGNAIDGGIGLSSNGDAVNIYNTSGTLIDGVTFGVATGGVSFGYDPSTGTFGALSVAGTNGAFVAPSGEVGSPGAVPEPADSALIVCGLGLLSGTYFLRRRLAA